MNEQLFFTQAEIDNGKLQIVWNQDKTVPEAIRYGSKELMVFWFPEKNLVHEYLATGKGSRLPSETSKVYSYLVNFCQELAIKQNALITCEVRPAVGQPMASWCQDKGEKVFGGWDFIQFNNKTSSKIFTKVFQPKISK